MAPLKLHTDHLLHGADYNPEQWLHIPGILEKDIELMKRANMNCVSVGIFSWAKLEPKEGIFDFDWLELIINNLYENGIFTILATPSGAKPLWMSEEYEEIRRVNQNLVREGSGERHNHCYTSPIYREKVRIINTKLAQRFGSHPGVLLWHISNEYSGTCYCELCQHKFRKWLKHRYKTLEKLNQAWWTAFWSHTYSDWSQIHAPVPTGETGTHGLVLDWKRFTTYQAVDFMKEEICDIRLISPNLPVTTNLMYDYDAYNYGRFAEQIDIVSWDSYPPWHGEDDIKIAADFAFYHDYVRTLKKQPFLLMESTPSTTNWTPVSKLKRPGMHMLSSMQAVAHGSDSVQYFQFRKSRGAFEKFHGAVVDHNGEGNTRVFQDVQRVGQQLQNLDAVKGSMPNPQVALVYDPENRWAIGEAKGPRNCGMHYSETVKAHYYAFWKKGIAVDVIDEEDDLEGYKLVAAPLLYMLRAGFEEKLRAFVKNGGTAVLTYHSGIVDETDLCILGGWPGRLMDVFGLWNEETEGLYDGEENSVTAWGKSYRVSEICARIHTKEAEVIGGYEKDFYQGEPAVTVNRFGAGNAYYIAAAPDQAFLDDFYDRLIESSGIKAVLQTKLPDGVTVTSRLKEDTEFLFVQNYKNEEAVLNFGEILQGLETGETFDQIQLKPYDVRILKRKIPAF